MLEKINERVGANTFRELGGCRWVSSNSYVMYCLSTGRLSEWEHVGDDRLRHDEKKEAELDDETLSKVICLFAMLNGRFNINLFLYSERRITDPILKVIGQIVRKLKHTLKSELATRRESKNPWRHNNRQTALSV